MPLYCHQTYDLVIFFVLYGIFHSTVHVFHGNLVLLLYSSIFSLPNALVNSAKYEGKAKYSPNTHAHDHMHANSVSLCSNFFSFDAIERLNKLDHVHVYSLITRTIEEQRKKISGN